MIKREILPIIESELRPQKVVLIYGARRVGKTVLIEHIAEMYSGRVNMLNGEDVSTEALLQERTVAHYRQLFGDTELLIIDEAQHIDDIGLILKMLVDNVPGLAVIASGSSSFNLRNSAGEPLVGRSYEFQLFPLSVSELLTQTTRFQLMQNIETLLLYGLYPELVSIPEAERKQRYLNELAQAYLLKDILSVDGIKNSSKMMQLLQLLAFQVGSEVSYEELSAKLGLSRNTVEKYIDLLAKTFVIYRLPAFSRNPRKEVSKPGKIYFCDNGIRNAVIGDFRPLALRQDVGALWENFIISERRKRQQNKGILSKHFFWRTIFTLVLTVNQAYAVDTTAELCGTSFVWRGQTCTQSGTYTYPGKTVAGCDSVVTLHLTLNLPTASEETRTEYESYTWNGKTYTASGTCTYTPSDDKGPPRIGVRHRLFLRRIQHRA